jgi:uncharacterized protein (TIGR04255 family)
MYYKRNFLTNVILRLDFNYLEALNTSATEELQFSKDIKDIYSYSSSQKMQNISVSIPDGRKISEDEIFILIYKNEEEGKKIISLMPNALVFEYKQLQYEHFNSFSNDIVFILQQFQKNYSVTEFTRLGLRYINEIEIPGIDPLNWEGYLNSELAQAVKAGLIKNLRVARSMHQLHLIKDDIIIIFNYGLYNKSYPNPVLFPALVLDYDCYIPNSLSEEDVLNSIKKLNKVAGELFENSIGESLRTLMEPTQ